MMWIYFSGMLKYLQDNQRNNIGSKTVWFGRQTHSHHQTAWSDCIAVGKEFFYCEFPQGKKYLYVVYS